MNANVGNAGMINQATNAGQKAINQAQDMGRQMLEGVGGMSGLEQFFLGLLVLIIIASLIYWAVYSRNVAKAESANNPIIITDPVNANSQSYPTINLPFGVDGMNFSYSYWVYVTDWSHGYGQPRYIMTRDNSPGFYFHHNTNKLITVMKTMTSNGQDNAGFEHCEVENFPLQKWVHVVYILNNRHVEIYINGKLEKTCALKNMPNINTTKPLQIAPGGGFYGQISNFQYFTRALQAIDVTGLYEAGPMLN